MIFIFLLFQITFEININSLNPINSQYNSINIENSNFQHFSNDILISKNFKTTVTNSQFHNINGNSIKLSTLFINEYDEKTTFNNVTSFIKNSLFESIINNENGGAIYSQFSTILLMNCLFCDLQSKTGSALYSLSSSIECIQNNFTNCFSTESSGAFHAKNTTNTIEFCIFYSCTCDSTGGALSLLFSTSTIHNSFFNKCKSQVASVIFIEGLSLEVMKTYFLNNICTTAGSPSIRGYLCNITFIECVFTNNTSNHQKVSVEVSRGFSIFDNTCFDHETSNFLSSSNYIFVRYDSCYQTSYPEILPLKHSTIDVSLKSSEDSSSMIIQYYFGLTTAISVLTYFILPSFKKIQTYIQTETRFQT